MTNTSRQRTPAAYKKRQPGPDDEVVPLIPAWARTWSHALLVAGAVVLVAAAVTGSRDGGSWGWALLFAMAAAVIAIWAWDYLRRARSCRETSTGGSASRASSP